MVACPDATAKSSVAVNGQREFALRVGFRRAGDLDGRRGVRGDADLPFCPVFTDDGEASGPVDIERLLGVRGSAQIVGPPRHGFVHGQRADLAVQAQGHAAAFGDVERACGHIGEIQRRLAGIARRLDPAFPDRAGGKGQSQRAVGRLGHGGDAPERAEDQGGHEEKKGHEPCAVGVVPRHPQIGLHGAGRTGAVLHPGQVRAPDRLGGGIVGSDGDGVGDGGDGTARQARVDAGDGLGPERQAEPAHPPEQARKHCNRGNHGAAPHHLDRRALVPAHQQRRQDQRCHGPQRPERARHLFGDHAQPGQPDGPRQMAQFLFRAGRHRSFGRFQLGLLSDPAS